MQALKKAVSSSNEKSKDLETKGSDDDDDDDSFNDFGSVEPSPRSEKVDTQKQGGDSATAQSDKDTGGNSPSPKVEGSDTDASAPSPKAQSGTATDV